MERHHALCEVNDDLSSLFDFGKKWKVQFEPTKTHAMLVSNTQDSGYFPMMSQLSFGGASLDLARVAEFSWSGQERAQRY